MKKLFVLIILSMFFLSGCLLKNNSQDVIKVTSENIFENKVTKNGKVLSLSTGINLFESGDVDGAIKFFNEYENFFSQSPKFYYYSGKAYLSKKLFKKALFCFEKSLALDNSQYDLYLSIADVSEKLNLKSKATENYLQYVFKGNDVSKNSEIRKKINSLAVGVKGSGIIGKIMFTDKTDTAKKLPVELMQAFSPEIPTIFALIDVINASKKDKIELKWNFINYKSEIIPVNSLSFNTDGTKTIPVYIKCPVTGWPTGKYEFIVFVNGVKNSSMNFYIF